MSNLTPDQIKVQKNLTNLGDLTDFVHGYAIDKINNAEDLIKMSPADRGQSWADALLGGAIWVMGDLEGFPGANLAAGLLSGVFTMYTTDTPPDLRAAFAGLWQRFDATFLQAQNDLAKYGADPVGNWNKEFKGPDGKTYTVGGLVNASVPAKEDPDTRPAFLAAAEEILKSFDYNLWKLMLREGWYHWQRMDDPQLLRHDRNWDHTQWARDFVNNDPSYFLVFEWYDNQKSSCCTHEEGWNVQEIWLGQNAGPGDQAKAPKALCDYLFKDDGAGTVVRENAIATREDVFTNFGLTKKQWYVVTPAVAAAVKTTAAAGTVKITKEFLRRPGKTIQELLATTTRQELEARVLAKAAEDPDLRYELLRRPKETLYKILDLKIPDGINVQVIDEKPDQFYLVLPAVGGPKP